MAQMKTHWKRKALQNIKALHSGTKRKWDFLPQVNLCKALMM